MRVAAGEACAGMPPNGPHIAGKMRFGVACKKSCEEGQFAQIRNRDIPKVLPVCTCRISCVTVQKICDAV